MSHEEFPSFQKTPQSQKKENKWASGILILSSLVFISLIIVLTFRFLVGSKTERQEMLPKILSASPASQSSLLMEWMQNLDQTKNKDWIPTEREQAELLRFSAARVNDLKQEGTSPALYALHVAGWGPGLSDNRDIDVLRQTSMSEVSTLAFALYLLRQKDFSPASQAYLNALVGASNEATRKIAGAYFTQCVAILQPTSSQCKTQMELLLGDSSDEVRWNVALGILRGKDNSGLFTESEVEKASTELGKLYLMIKNGDPTLLSRFNGPALESLAREVFSIKYKIDPQQMKQDLEVISRSHVDLRIRNLARSFELKFQEK